MRVSFAVGILSLMIGVASLSPADAATGSDSTAPIVGRWQQSHTCDELVSALNAEPDPGRACRKARHLLRSRTAASLSLLHGVRALRFVGPVPEPSMTARM